jgi:hypothetical protein
MKMLNQLKMILTMMVIIVIIFSGKTNAQAFAIKGWSGTYPQMNENYPLTFMAFKGFLIPIPHFFIRTWPTHYYLEVGAMPVTDAPNLTGEIKTGFFRIVEKILERSQLQQRSDETAQIKGNEFGQKNIELKLFNSRSEYLSDIYGISSLFIRLDQSISNLGKQANASAIVNICRRDADQLMVRFLMINLLQTDHGKKLEAFAQIRDELSAQIGETDYTNQKVCHYNFYSEPGDNSYTFLSR